MFNFLFKNKKSVYEQNKDLILNRCSHWLQSDCGSIISGMCGIMILSDELLEKSQDNSYPAPLNLDDFIRCIQFLDDFPIDVRNMTLQRLSDKSYCYWKNLYKNWEELSDMYWYLSNTPFKEHKVAKQREDALEKRLLEILGIHYTKNDEE